jgi:hypothetical protein
MTIELTAKSNEVEIINFLNSVGAKEVHVQEAETGWWLGRYDNDSKPFDNMIREEHSATA